METYILFGIPVVIFGYMFFGTIGSILKTRKEILRLKHEKNYFYGFTNRK